MLPHIFNDQCSNWAYIGSRGLSSDHQEFTVEIFNLSLHEVLIIENTFEK